MEFIKHIITISYIFLSINICYSQPFDEAKTLDTISFLNSEGTISKVGKYNLTLQLNVERLYNYNYLDSVYSHIYNLKARIDYISLSDEDRFISSRKFFENKNIEIRIIPPDYTNIGAMDIRIADTSDIFNVKSFLENTGLFESISFFPVFEESSGRLKR